MVIATDDWLYDGTVVFDNGTIEVTHEDSYISYLQYPVGRNVALWTHGGGLTCAINYNNTHYSFESLNILEPATLISSLSTRSILATTDELNITMTVTLSSASQWGFVEWNLTNGGQELLSNVKFFEWGEASISSPALDQDYGEYNSTLDEIVLYNQTASDKMAWLRVWSLSPSIAHDLGNNSTSLLSRMSNDALNNVEAVGPTDVWWGLEWDVGSLNPGDSWQIGVYFEIGVTEESEGAVVGGEILSVTFVELLVPYLLIVTIVAFLALTLYKLASNCYRTLPLL
jgi:hypothetical protein